MHIPFSISKLVWVRIIYWLFLTYMVAAFIWWYVALVKQNELLTATKIETLVAAGNVDQQHIATIEAFAARKISWGRIDFFNAFSFRCYLRLPFFIKAVEVFYFTTKFHDGCDT